MLKIPAAGDQNRINVIVHAVNGNENGYMRVHAMKTYYHLHAANNVIKICGK